MAAADFAVAASAGAIALALSTTLWSWRFRKRCELAVAALKARLDAAETALGEAEAAASAFDGALLAVEGREARLISGEDGLQALARALGLGRVDAIELLRALTRTSPEHERAVEALISAGEPFRFELPTPAGVAVVEGRPSGAIAWIRACAHRRRRPPPAASPAWPTACPSPPGSSTPRAAWSGPTAPGSRRRRPFRSRRRASRTRPSTAAPTAWRPRPRA